ncbi:MAG: hypothetical protein Q9199_003641 [Rusavskia elegans]
MLDCYLKKNLVTHGGFLDEVLFAVNTDNKADIKYLHQLIKTNKLYKKITLPNGKPGYKEAWKYSVVPEHMYIKIDEKHDQASTGRFSRQRLA